MKKVLVLFDQDLHAAPLFAAAKKLSDDVTVFKILPERIDATAHALADTVSNYDAVLFPSTVFYRALVPYLARLLNVFPLTDVSGITAEKTFLRYVSAGQALAHVDAGSMKPLLMTVMTGAFFSTEKVSFETLALSFKQSNVEFVLREATKNARPKLASAKTVIGVGLGLDRSDLPLIKQLADTLSAAICATRPLIDQGLFPAYLQVGQTGISIAPDVYLALGISGAMQHLAGIKNARKVIAVNTDPAAPIFKFAHVGMVCNLKDVAQFLLNR